MWGERQPAQEPAKVATSLPCVWWSLERGPYCCHEAIKSTLAAEYGCVGNWLHPFFSSLSLPAWLRAVVCNGPLPDPPANATQFNSTCQGAANNAVCRASCQFGYSGSVNTTCLNGNWGSASGVCTAGGDGCGMRLAGRNRLKTYTMNSSN